MDIHFFCPLWGSESLSFSDFCSRVQKAGYNGVELSFPVGETKLRANRLAILADFGLLYIAQHWETTEPNLARHQDEYRRRLDFLAEAKPLFINSQTGRDWFTLDDNLSILSIADRVSADTGLAIIHETHRGKLSFSAQVTKAYLQARPDLRLTADFSHWCNVSESLLADQSDAVDLAIGRADHIHARIGHAEGPQVPDPRSPEWQTEVQAHLGWWDRILAAHRERASRRLTICPEFGPFPYMTPLPSTGQPIADQWEINTYMMNLLRDRWQTPPTARN